VTAEHDDRHTAAAAGREEARHVTKERGSSTFIFTEQLLRSTYEMAALAAEFTTPAEAQ
jgi:hypothetical protein